MTGQERLCFQQLDHPMTLSDAAKTVYPDGDDSLAEILGRMNGIHSRTQIIDRGVTLIVPPPIGSSDAAYAYARQVRESTDWHANHAANKPAPTLFNDDFFTFLTAKATDEAERTGLGLDMLATFTGMGGEMVDKTLSGLRDDLNMLHRELAAIRTPARDVAQKRRPHLPLEAGRREVIRLRIGRRLEKLPQSIRQAAIGGSGSGALARIATRTQMRNFSVGTTPHHLKLVRKALTSVDDVARRLGDTREILLLKFGKTTVRAPLMARSLLGNAGPLLTAASGAVMIADLKMRISKVEAIIPAAADLYALHATAKTGGEFLGSLAGGVSVAVALGTPVGWGGLAVVGLVSIGASLATGWVGGEIASEITESYLRRVSPQRAEDIELIMRIDDVL